MIGSTNLAASSGLRSPGARMIGGSNPHPVRLFGSGHSRGTLSTPAPGGAHERIHDLVGHEIEFQTAVDRNSSDVQGLAGEFIILEGGILRSVEFELEPLRQIESLAQARSPTSIGIP